MSNSGLAISLFVFEAIITPYHTSAEPLGTPRVKFQTTIDPVVLFNVYSFI